MNPTRSFAFLVDFRSRLPEDLAPVSRPTGLLPKRVHDLALRRLPAPPVSRATVHIGGVQVGHVVLVPFGALDMAAYGAPARERVRRAVDEAVDEAVGLGASVVGLGALTAPVTADGASLRGRTDVGVTNGSAFTAAIVHDRLRGVLASATAGRVAIVGATDGVGTTLAKLLVRGREADEVLLVARDQGRLASLACNLSGRGVAVRTSLDPHQVRSADVVVLDAASGSLLRPEHLGAGAVVVTASQPRTASADVARRRPDVAVLDGGIVSIPSLRIRGGDVGLPDGRAYACLAEAALLALSGHRGHFSVGIPNLGQVEHVRALAREYASLGFTLATPTSLEAPPPASTPPSAADGEPEPVVA